MYCIVGLGNPGREYNGTRHNIGFAVVEAIARELNTRIRRRAYSALTATVRLDRSEVLIIKPQTYMNLSGRSVRAALLATGVPVEHVVVVHDDVDLPLGRIRVRAGGGAGGHKGVSSIIGECGSSDFVRVKVGVGRPSVGTDTADHVLDRFDHCQTADVERATTLASRAVRCVVTRGVDRAMAEFNAPPERPEP